MTTCEKHGCPLKELLTSTYCPRCDEEAAVNARPGSGHATASRESRQPETFEAALKRYMDGVVTDPDEQKRIERAAHRALNGQDIGWYHNYPVCGTDANGSDVDDMDVCMGFKSEAEAKVVCDRIMARILKAQESPQPDVCMGLVSKDELDRHMAAAKVLAAWAPPIR